MKKANKSCLQIDAGLLVEDVAAVAREEDSAINYRIANGTEQVSRRLFS